MNVERLHRVLKDLGQDIEKTNLSKLLSSLVSHLQNQVNNPQDANHQKKLSETYDNLKDGLRKSDYNEYSPGRKQIIEEIGGQGILGIELSERIEDIFSRNQITAANALEEIKSIVEEFNTFEKSISLALEAFKGLSIDDEELEDGQCELGYTIPRGYVDNRLGGLEHEIHELNFILRNIGEAVTGEIEEFKLKTISSSDFLLYIIIGLQVADILAKSTERILNIYKSILEIKVKRNELKEMGIPDSQTKGIETHANSMMAKEIKQIADEIVEGNFNGDEKRKNELTNGVVFALNKLANRIDNGFNVEIRIKPLKEKSEDEEQDKTEEDIKQEELISSIQKSARNIEYIKTKGKSILELPEGNEK